MGLSWKITRIRTTPVLVSHPKQIKHSPKCVFVSTVPTNSSTAQNLQYKFGTCWRLQPAKDSSFPGQRDKTKLPWNTHFAGRNILARNHEVGGFNEKSKFLERCSCERRDAAIRMGGQSGTKARYKITEKTPILDSSTNFRYFLFFYHNFFFYETSPLKSGKYSKTYLLCCVISLVLLMKTSWERYQTLLATQTKFHHASKASWLCSRNLTAVGLHRSQTQEVCYLNSYSVPIGIRTIIHEGNLKYITLLQCRWWKH